MSYHQQLQRRPRPARALALSGNVGPQWYRELGGLTSQPPGPRVTRSLGSLGDDAPSPTTLSTPTVVDPATGQWQANVLAQMQAGVSTMRKAELQKWLQIIATVSIPLSAAIWRLIFKRGVDPTA